MEEPRQDKDQPSGREVRTMTAVSIDDGVIITTTDTPGPLVARIHESISTVLNNGPKRVLLEIDALVASGDMPGAAQLLVAVHEQQETGWGKPIALCKTVARVPLSALDATTAMAFARARLELRHRARLFADAAEDAAFLLKHGDARDQRDKRSLEMVVALGDYERGEKESAILQFRRFAEDAQVDSIDRAWSLRNLMHSKRWVPAQAVSTCTSDSKAASPCS
jgi:hypothetical protein